MQEQIKPDINTLLFVTLVRGSKNGKDSLKEGYFIGDDYFESFIFPLRNISIIESKKEIEFIIRNLPQESLSRVNHNQKCLRAAVSFTLDPRMENACDWSDLGCYRKVIKFLDPKIKKIDNDLVFKIKKNPKHIVIETHTTVADRRMKPLKR